MALTTQRLYLIAYNGLSALGWAIVLCLTVIHTLNLDGQSTDANGGSIFHQILRNSSTTFSRVGSITAFVQTCAILEVLHVLLRWVRSPLATTAMQVSSRLYLVWGIVARSPKIQEHGLYTSMVLAWSMTEVIRYSYYALNLLNLENSLVTWLRYTTFFVLYPLGASSEALLIRASLPNGWRTWSIEDFFCLGLFIIWWPGLYVMYTYMISQRKKVLNRGVPKAKAH